MLQKKDGPDIGRLPAQGSAEHQGPRLVDGTGRAGQGLVRQPASHQPIGIAQMQADARRARIDGHIVDTAFYS